MTTFHVTHGDINRAFSVIISDADGDAVDLTTRTVDFLMWTPSASAFTVDGEATNDAETTGKSDYAIDDWSGIPNPGLNNSALYRMVWRMTSADGTIDTVPNINDAHIVIVDGVP